MKINGKSGDHVNIEGPDWPIVIDGSGSPCATSYFVSIQLSDAQWSRYGYEAMQWLTAGDAQYGDIAHFNLKKFAEDRWFRFVPGQYYRVKLGVGPGFTDTSTLIYIAAGGGRRRPTEPPVPASPPVP